MKWLLIFTLMNSNYMDSGSSAGVVYLETQEQCVEVAKEMYKQATSIRHGAKFKSTCMEIK